MNRLLRAGVATLAAGALLGLTACSTSSDASDAETGTTTITFSSYNYGTQGAAGEGTQKLLDRFAQLHPEITVRPQAVATADVLTKTKASVAAGSPPDVVQMGYSKLAESFDTLPVQPLESIAGDEWESSVEGIDEAFLTTGTSDGEVRALPYTVSVPTLFYNADLFRDAGLDPDDPPATIDEVRSAAEAIVEAGHHGVYFGIVDSAKSDYVTQSVINSAGGSLVTADGGVGLDSPEAVAGLAAVQGLTADGLQPAVGIEDALADFANGNMGMFVVSTAASGQLAAAAEGAFELRSGGFPAFGTGDARPTFSGAGLVVLSEDPAKQAAAWEFVKFLTSKEGYTIITEDIGYLPLRADIVDDPEYLGDYFAEHDLLVPPLEQLDTVSPYQSFDGPRANQAVVLLQDDAIEPIVLRDADVRTTLADTADRLRELVGAE
ncbi:ABC transporter substrate-binding protein [Myceligenerans pegani]|uniref:ABC transporter substrate-binding protein n=1 Tax=Myceligenerans pegani TaxID=2776917 RepID=A0ABR9MZ43_9MICO|nr:ABC transporter substrate-binding protein [Myceligenerans sp. TRM 65318]MBE1876649.1 ABC transporter substrate-binding protein [Myceligenerans sp. TRM 65318]MBE3018920.1 ABC transporter substrate-binding protein [Myceligenerans sp. TRM 65318]